MKYRLALSLPIALAVAAASVAVANAASASLPPGCYLNSTNKVVCEGRSEEERPNDERGPAGPPTTVYPFREHWRPVLSQDVDGNTCVTTETVRLGRDPNPTEDMNSEMQFLRLMRSFPICPDAELPTTTPAMEAAAFFQQITLPVPTPYVQPGSLPVGFEAFLETGAPTSQTFGPVDTPFGPLTLTATAQIYVDWDDPHDGVVGEEGPYAGPPGPYPDGQITHVYQYHGVYDIAVRYVWTATWAIGGVTGTIDGAETSGSYPDPGFEAFSREAVGR